MENDPLEHDTRKKVYNHITSNPGVEFSVIKNVFDLTEGTLRYHLKYLESHDEIRSCIEGKVRCYYPIQNLIFDHRVDSELEILKLNNTQTLLIDTIKRYPGVTQKDLMFKTGLSRITIVYNLGKLLDFGVVRKKPEGKYITYFYLSNSELRRNMIGRLIHKFINYELDEETFLALKERLDSE